MVAQLRPLPIKFISIFLSNSSLPYDKLKDFIFFFNLDYYHQISCQNYSQQAQAIFDKILGPRNKNYPGLISMSQGFQKYIAWNSS